MRQMNYIIKIIYDIRKEQNTFILYVNYISIYILYCFHFPQETPNKLKEHLSWLNQLVMQASSVLSDLWGRSSNGVINADPNRYDYFYYF